MSCRTAILVLSCEGETNLMDTLQADMVSRWNTPGRFSSLLSKI